MMRFDWAIWKANFPLTGRQETLISNKNTFMPKRLTLKRAGSDVVIDEEEARTVLLPLLAETFPELTAEPKLGEALTRLEELVALPIGSVVLLRGVPYRKLTHRGDGQSAFWEGPKHSWRTTELLDPTKTVDAVLLLWRAASSPAV